MPIPNQISLQAENILKKHDLYKPNVDLEKLAEIYGIEIECSDPGDDELSGALVRKDEEATIFVNSTHADTRRRFSLAHELGHFFLHKGKETFIDGKATGYLLRAKNVSPSDYLTEREANEFAAALLMPSDLISKELKEVEKKGASDVISDIAEKFNVSQQAMSFRLLNLGYIL